MSIIENAWDTYNKIINYNNDTLKLIEKEYLQDTSANKDINKYLQVLNERRQKLFFKTSEEFKNNNSTINEMIVNFTLNLIKHLIDNQEAINLFTNDNNEIVKLILENFINAYTSLYASSDIKDYTFNLPFNDKHIEFKINAINSMIDYAIIKKSLFDIDNYVEICYTLLSNVNVEKISTNDVENKTENVIKHIKTLKEKKLLIIPDYMETLSPSYTLIFCLYVPLILSFLLTIYENIIYNVKKKSN